MGRERSREDRGGAATAGATWGAAAAGLRPLNRGAAAAAAGWAAAAAELFNRHQG